MDKAIKTILETLNNQIDSNELTTSLKADKFEGEYALSEDGITSILDQTKGLLSVESAINNADIIEKISKDLYPKHMKSSLSKVEEPLKDFFDIIGIDYSNYEFVSDALKDVKPRLEELMNANGDDTHKELVGSLKGDIIKQKEINAQQAEDFKAQIEQRDNDVLVDKIKRNVMSMATERPMQDAYMIPGAKKSILRTVWENVNAKAHLKLNENGVVSPMQKEFPDKELFDGNKVMTIQRLLEPELEPYLKKSEPVKPTTPNGEGKQFSEKELQGIAEFERRKKAAAQ